MDVSGFGENPNPIEPVQDHINSRVREECLNINMFWSLAQSRVVIGDW